MDHLLVRADVLEPEAGKWNLIEVKASTSTKPEHIDDLAVQWHVLSRSGLPLNRAFLLRLNGDYVRAGDLILAELFTREDLTEEVKAAAAQVPERIERFRKVITANQMPALDVGGHCDKPHPCRFSGHCWATIPPLSVHYIPRISAKKLVLLKEMQILEQHQIPDDFDLSPTQKKWISVARSGLPALDRPAVKRALSGLTYPLIFLDFESVNLAVPPFDGLWPFAQMPFQASVRILEEHGAERHEEFLGDGKTDPRPSLARFLAEKIPPTGTVVAYFATFERGRLTELADFSPAVADALNGISARLWDLLEVFSKGHYLDHRFQGSTSIKYVLPVLVPEMSYAGLRIKDGTDAAAAYVRMMFEDLSADERSGLTAGLKEYCGQDTLAMVRVLEVIRNAVSKGDDHAVPAF